MSSTKIIFKIMVINNANFPSASSRLLGTKMIGSLDFESKLAQMSKFVFQG